MAKMHHFENPPLWKFPKLSGGTYCLKSFQIYIFKILKQVPQKVPTGSQILTLLRHSYSYWSSANILALNCNLHMLKLFQSNIRFINIKQNWNPCSLSFLPMCRQKSIEFLSYSMYIHSPKTVFFRFYIFGD